MSNPDAKQPLSLRERLARPFAADEVKWKAQVVRDTKALAVAFVDARVVMDRLDDCFGLGGWQTEYRELAKGSVCCTLRTKVDGEWITHQDVGSESEQPDEGDRTKSAYSDSLKRAAVHLGISRYLYRLPMQWCDYDPKRRQFVRTPSLPTWALPDPLDRGKENLRETVERAAVAVGKPTPEMYAEAERLREMVGIPALTFVAHLKEKFGVETLEALSAEQLKRVLDGLRGRLKTQQPAGAK